MSSPKLPVTEKNMKVGKFKKYLQNCGGQILTNTSQWEILRVQTDTGVLILYKNKAGVLNWPPRLRSAWIAYKSGGKLEWKAANHKKTKRVRTPVLVKTVWERDGKKCWYCGCPLTWSTTTLEHILNICHGGSNHLANLTVACGTCNQKARNMCITDKVKLRERLKVTGGSS